MRLLQMRTCRQMTWWLGAAQLNLAAYTGMLTTSSLFLYPTRKCCSGRWHLSISQYFWYFFHGIFWLMWDSIMLCARQLTRCRFLVRSHIIEDISRMLTMVTHSRRASNPGPLWPLPFWSKPPTSMDFKIHTFPRRGHSLCAVWYRACPLHFGHECNSSWYPDILIPYLILLGEDMHLQI